MKPRTRTNQQASIITQQQEIIQLQEQIIAKLKALTPKFLSEPVDLILDDFAYHHYYSPDTDIIDDIGAWYETRGNKGSRGVKKFIINSRAIIDFDVKIVARFTQDDLIIQGHAKPSCVKVIEVE